MLLLVGPPERSIARNNIPSRPPGFIPPLLRSPPMLTGVVRSKVGVWPPNCALLEPGLAAVGRAPQIVTVERLCWPGGLQTQIEEVPHFVGFGYRVASENSILENTGEGPVYAGISAITPAALPKVGGYVVKLPPGDCHPVPICWVNGNNTLVGRVA